MSDRDTYYWEQLDALLTEAKQQRTRLRTELSYEASFRGDLVRETKSSLFDPGGFRTQQVLGRWMKAAQDAADAAAKIEQCRQRVAQLLTEWAVNRRDSTNTTRVVPTEEQRGSSPRRPSSG